ncbi:cyclin-dependent kinase inhibitor 1Ba [Hoplias malabaricus]|uniref:cyclin-dependent kinase inhibitor 1Ba n=1 Tax=Hoplias malabaricus TaxID=27720 RepID=UPI003461CBDE
MSDVRLSNGSPPLERVDARPADHARPPVCRVLFGSSGGGDASESTERLREMERASCDKWNFDFASDQALPPGQFEWEAVDSRSVPEFYSRPLRGAPPERSAERAPTPSGRNRSPNPIPENRSTGGEPPSDALDVAVDGRSSSDFNGRPLRVSSPDSVAERAPSPARGSLSPSTRPENRALGEGKDGERLENGTASPGDRKKRKSPATEQQDGASQSKRVKNELEGVNTGVEETNSDVEETNHFSDESPSAEQTPRKSHPNT